MRRAWWLGLGALASLTAAVWVTNATVPEGTAGVGTVDALIVLGVPAFPDGRPTPMQRWRVAEAVREYRAGQARHVIFSGGAAANRFAEADAMAAVAVQLGVPADAVVREARSRTTMENLAYSQAICDAHGWHRVEVISSPDHLRRASVMLADTHLVWRVHAAPTPGRKLPGEVFSYAREAVGTTILRWFGPRAELLLHAVAQGYRRMLLRLGLDA